MEKEKNIALVIKTDGLEYDDRVRKEILTVQKLYPSIRFKIFVMLPENKEATGVTGYGVPYKSVYIPSRDKYPSAKKTALKSYEFYKFIKEDLKNFDAIWCANEDTAVIAAMVSNKHLLWDLHELPTSLMRGMTKKLLLRYIFSRCKVVVHANDQRKDYLKRIGVIKKIEKHFSLRNFPNFEDIDGEYDDKYREFIEWKGENRCVYLQGLTTDARSAYESISSVLQVNNLRAAVIGKFDEKSKEKLVKEYGDDFNKRVFFVGKIPQLKIPQYMKQCCMTLVFYKNTRANNYYCEANRFYQAVILGLPVVVGCNPTMKELVDTNKYGVSIDDDGRSVDKITKGIQEVLEHYDYYCNNVKMNQDKLLWKTQESEIGRIIQILLS